MPHIAAKPLTVFNLNRDRRAKRATVTDTANQDDLVLFKLLSRTTPKTQATSGQFGIDILRSDF
jgi:hypothetical protein